MSVQLSTPPSSNGRQSEKSTSPKSGRKKFFSNLLHRKQKNESSPLMNQKKGVGSRSSSVSTKIGSTPSFSKSKNQSGISDIALRRSRSQARGRSKGPERDCIDDDNDIVLNYAEDGKEENDVSNNISDMSSSSSSFSGILSSPSFFDESGGKFKNSSQTNIDQIFDLTILTTGSHIPWDGLSPEALVVPQYVKTHRRNKHSPKSLNNLFLAQELNVESCDSKSNIDNDSMSSESLKQGNSSDDEHDEIFDEHEVERGRVHSDSQGCYNGLSSKRQSKSDHNEVYVMEFSRDGKYLAVAGRNTIIKIWKVISSPLNRLEQNNIESEMRANNEPENKNKKLYQGAPVFHQAPVRVFRGHNHSILSLDWSKNNFLISGSMDRLVKLWHVDRPDCLGTFQNDDFVTTVKFHPNDDRFFLSGSLDNQVRLWSILEKTIAYSKDLGDDVLITAASFTPDGQHCIIGGFNGSIFALEVHGLHIIHKFDVKEKHFVQSFHNKNGNKITGIKIFESHGYPKLNVVDSDPLAKWNFLITTNDSKIRLVNSDLRKLVTRFKGLTNNSSSIVASMTDDFHYIISGSEDHWCYIWENNNSIINNKLKLALKDLVLEGKNHINDLQSKHKSYANLIHKNPLMKKLNVQKFLEDENHVEYVANENNSYVAFHPHHSKVNVAIFAPENTKKLLEFSDDLIFDLVKRGKHNFLGKENSESFKNDVKDENSNQSELGSGNIIVTTDQYGLIRVYRQDSAYEARKKLRDFLKLKKDNNLSCRYRSDTKNFSNNQVADSKSTSKNNLKIEIPYNHVSRSLLVQNRSVSPSHESYLTLKNKLHNKIKGCNSGNSSNINNNSSTSSGNSGSMYRMSLNRSSSQTNLPRLISSSSLVNGGILHNSQSSLGIMPQFDATVDIQRDDDTDDRSFSESPYLPEAGNNMSRAPESAYTLALSRSSDNKSASTLTGPASASSDTDQNSGLDHPKAIPLLVNTRSADDKGEHEPEIIDFHTPVSNRRSMDRAFDGMADQNMNSFNIQNNYTRGRM